MNAPSYDWRTLPLAGDGRSLIEASAGTGKTWTIAALYQRLLLEDRLLPPQIVVTTFTNAAAQELRDRLRARLVTAASLAEALSAGAPAPVADRDDDDGWLVERWEADPALLAGERIHLRLALAELDLAPITTLHGLCGLLLSEHALDTGAGFAPGAMTSGKTLDEELRDDLWRRLAQSRPQELDAGDSAWAEAGRKAFNEALKKVCVPGAGVRLVDLAALLALMTRDNAESIRDWARNVRCQPRKTKLRNRLLELADYLEAADLSAPLPTIKGEKGGLAALLVDQLPSEALEIASDHAAIHLVREALARMPHSAQAADKSEALARYRESFLRERDLRLRERDQLSYDALISRSRAALEGPNGDRLAGRLREKWKVALVDEFQDTDIQQYTILDRIWRDAEHAPRGRLVMIGDPKQAIYAFRGGDIDAYLAAREDAHEVMRLAINRRSSANYIAACNELFADRCASLGTDTDTPIQYEPALPGRGPKRGALTCDGEPVARPLAFHIQSPPAEEPESGGKRLKPKAGDARAAALEACANHIADLLQRRRHRIGDRLLVPGDLAVLLPKNDDIARLRELLAARGVPCVGAGSQAVFDTDIARALQVLLYGIAHAHEPTAVRAALATRFFLARDFDALRALSDDNARWQRELQRFADWRRQWQEEGVQAVVGAVVAASADRFAGRADAERVLTDLRHLGELLQARTARGDGPAALLAWFADQREGDDAADEDAEEERELRIESDARRVRLATLHKSKGLQFPIVFLPLMWAHEGKSATLPLARDAATGERLLDLGGPDCEEAKRADEQAAQDERFRVLYVALTRAEHACHVLVPHRDDAADPKRSALCALLERLRGRLGDCSVEEACPHIAWSPGWNWPELRYEPERVAVHAGRNVEPLPAPRPLAARHSFTTLAQHRDPAIGEDAASDEAAAGPAVDSAVDATEAADAEPHPELAALAAWRGTAFGNALHAVFEQRALATPLRAQHELVLRCLHEAGFKGTDAEALVRRLAARAQAVLDAELDLGGGRHLRLADLPAQRLRAEMGFDYALDGASIRRLREACTRHGAPDLVPVRAPHVLRGLMTGAIDLVFEHAGRFHVLDWKSNFLGEHLAGYAPTALRAAMDAHHYRFQALLYTIALDRYLRQRLRGYRREGQLGEAVYLFVRAVGLAPGAGVWTHRFDDGLIAAVDAALAGSDDAEAA
ncbi:MAG TPA: UvrD-helicase domain-containing protein [Xanthomonadaceae bacterium]|jgi:exodeoxyribonuclease V beta subunit